MRLGRSFLVGASVPAIVLGLGLGAPRAQDVGIRPARSAATEGLFSASAFETQEYLADYGLRQMNASTAYARGYTGHGILVAVYDTGIDAGHPEFAGRISSASRNEFVSATVPISPSLIDDTDAHGTHVSGSIAAARDGRGMMGVGFDASILTLYGLPSERLSEEIPDLRTTSTSLIDRAREQGAKVFNGSYGPNLPNPNDNGSNYERLTQYKLGPEEYLEYEAMKRAAESDMLIVMAAGNDYQIQTRVATSPSGAALYPFINPANAGSGIYQFYGPDGRRVDQSGIDFSSLSGFIVSVVAVDKNNRIADFSNRCGVTAEWCIASAGVQIYSTGPRDMGQEYYYESGTSMAAPHVAGAAAVLRQAFPFLTAPQIAQTMFTTATPIGPREIYGWGLLNLGKAIDGPGQFTSTWNVDTQGYFGTFANDISGVGGLVKTGAGTLELTGFNTFTGGVAIDGGTLKVAADANLGAQGVGLAFGGGTLQVGRDGFSSARPVTLDTSGTFQIDAGTATLSGVVADGGSGPGSLAKTGPGTLELAGANTYTGATTISSGTLALVGAGSVAASRLVQADGTFDISAASGAGASIRTLAGRGAVALGSRTLTITNGSTSFAGAIAGSGGLALAGGSQTLAGANTYTGVTQIAGGAALTLGGSLVSPVSVAALGRFTNTGLAAGGVTNAGTFVTSGLVAGGLVNTGSVTASAGRIDGQVENLSGSLTVTGAVATAGNVRNAAAASIAVTGSGNYAVSGLLTNAGSITIARTGVLTAGAVLNTGSLVDEGEVEVDIVNSGTLMLSGPVAGTISNEPGGTIRLANAAASFKGFDNEGRTDLDGRSVAVGALTGDNPGAVLTNATLTVGNGTSSFYAGSIVDGAGQTSLTKIGTGTLTLAGASTYTGPTRVSGGILSVNGSITSPVTVGAAGTLRGTGFIAAPVSVAGVLAPGNSPGTLVVAGPVTFGGGSTLSLDIDGPGTGSGAGNYARLFAVGPAGTVAAGGTIAPVLRGIAGSATNSYVPALGQRFGVLATSGGLTGSFAGIAQPASGLLPATRFDALYGAAALDLVVTPAAYGNLAANGLAQSGNARAIGAAIDGARPAAGVRPGQDRAFLFDALYTAAPTSLGGGLASLSGQTYGDALMAALEGRRLLSGTIDRHLTLGGGGGASLRAGESGGRGANPVFEMRQDAGGADRRLAIGEGRIWADGIYGFGDRGGDRNAGGARFDTGGVVAGIDYRLGPDTLVGGAFSYLRGVGDTNTGGSALAPGRFGTDSFGGTLYGTTRLGDVELRGQAGGGYASSRIDRLASLGSFVRRSSGSPDGLDAGISAFAGYRLGLDLPVDVIPEVGFSYDVLTRSGAMERSALPISFGGFRTADLDAARSLVGLRLASVAPGDLQDLRFDARAYWAHELADAGALIRSDIFGQAFTTRTSRLGRNGAVLGLGLSGALAPGARLAIGYTGEVRPGATAHSFTAGLNVTW